MLFYLTNLDAIWVPFLFWKLQPTKKSIPDTVIKHTHENNHKIRVANKRLNEISSPVMYVFMSTTCVLCMLSICENKRTHQHPTFFSHCDNMG